MRISNICQEDDVANAIHYIVAQPPHIPMGDIVIQPTQDYPQINLMPFLATIVQASQVTHTAL